MESTSKWKEGEGRKGRDHILTQIPPSAPGDASRHVSGVAMSLLLDEFVQRVWLTTAALGPLVSHQHSRDLNCWTVEELSRII